MKHKFARAAVVVALASSFTLASGAAFARSGASPAGKSAKVDGSVQDCLAEKSNDFYCPEEDSSASGGKTGKKAPETSGGGNGGSVVQKGAYPYEEPGTDGKYRLDERMCREALGHPEPPHQDGDRWAYWSACKDEYGTPKAPAKEHQPEEQEPEEQQQDPAPRSEAPTVHITPTFTG